MTRKRIDWEAIEAEYSAGIKSIRSIANAFGVAESTIRKRAGRYGWQRDLSSSVRSAVKSKLVRTAGAQSEVRTDADIIDSASDEIAQVVIGHRQNISAYKSIAVKLACLLAEMEVDDSNHGDFSRSLNSGVDALGKLIKLERQAYSMDEEQGNTEPPEASISDADLDSRIARLTGANG